MKKNCKKNQFSSYVAYHVFIVQVFVQNGQNDLKIFSRHFNGALTRHAHTVFWVSFLVPMTYEVWQTQQEVGVFIIRECLRDLQLVCIILQFNDMFICETETIE